MIAEADAQKLPLMDYAARKFNFAQREQELAAKADAENRAKISAEAVAPLQKQIEEERAKSAEERSPVAGSFEGEGSRVGRKDWQQPRSSYCAAEPVRRRVARSEGK